MTSQEKVNKKSKKSKKNQKEEKKDSEVLEKVMDSIEMAGASMDFIEETDDENSPDTNEEVLEASEAENELDQALADDDTDSTIEASSDDNEEKLEALSSEEESPESEEETQTEMEASRDDDEDEENLELIEDDTKEFVEQNQALSIIESLLFASERPLGIGTFKTVFKGTTFKTKDIKKALEELQSVYADPARGVSLEEINGGWQLRTKVDNLDFLRKLGKAKPFRLSGPALEVMSIIAYKQPIIKSEIDEIRGVESGHLVRALMEKNLVNFQGKSELPGKPMQYGTTRKFLEIFGLRNLRELPSLDEIDQLLPDGIGIEEEDEKLSDVTESLSEDYQGNYSEGEEELTKIEDTLEGIDTSSEFFEEEKRRQKEKRDRDRARDIREALDVGEEVETKDVKWLERYDKKLEEMQAEKEAAEQAKAEAAALESEQEAGENEADRPDELIPSGESLTGELSKLTTENLIDADTMARDEELELKDEQSESEDSLAEENNLPLSEPESESSEEATMQAGSEELHPDNQIEISEPPADGEVEESVQAQADSEGDDSFETFDPFSDSTEDDSEDEPSPAN